MPWVWRLPQSCSQFAYPPALASAKYNQGATAVRAARSNTSGDDLGAKLRLWSAVNEEAIHGALKEAHANDPEAYPQAFLPKSHQGRCLPQKRIQGQPATLPKQGRHGQPSSHGEATSVKSRQRLKQCRCIPAQSSAVQQAFLLGACSCNSSGKPLFKPQATGAAL